MRSVTTRVRRTTSPGAALAVLLALAATGCTTIGRRYGEPPPPTLPTLEEGVARASDVVHALGPPSRLSALPGGAVMLYEFIDATENQLGLNLEVIGLSWFKAALGRGRAEREALLLFFDQGGVLQSSHYESWSEVTGRGFGFQLFFVAMPTVDTRHLWEIPEQFTWGKRSLEPLAVTLNECQTVTSGTKGLEMRGTPDSVGQRTLEMLRKRRRR